MSQLDSLLDELGRHEIPVAEEAPIDFDALFPRRKLFRRGLFEEKKIQAKKPFKKETFYALGEIKPKRAGDMMVGASLPPAYTGQTEPEEPPKFAETPSSSILMNLMDYGKNDFIGILSEILETHFKEKEKFKGKLRIQEPIESLEGTRQQIYRVNFLCGDVLRCIYIKHGSEKESLLYLFENSIGIPTPNLIGFDPEKGLYDKMYALLDIGFFLGNVGEPFADIMNRLSSDSFIKYGRKVVDLLARIHIESENHIDDLRKLEEKYKLEIDSFDEEQLINERLLNFIHPDAKAGEEFIEAYLNLIRAKKLKGELEQNDCQPYNVTVGTTTGGYDLSRLYILDWELAQKNSPVTTDPVTWGITTSSLRKDRDDISGKAISQFVAQYGKNRNNLSSMIQHDSDIMQYIGHTLKIGDNIMILNTGKAKDMNERQQRAAWFLTQLFEKAIKESYLRNVTVPYAKAALKLFESANLPYLNPVVQNYNGIRQL